MFRRAAALAIALCCASARAAVVVRLVHGGEWDVAGAAVRKTLSSAAFKSAARGRYTVEFSTESPVPGSSGAATLGLPAVFAADGSGRAFFAMENVSASATAEAIIAAVSEADAERKAQEARGFKTAERCGEALFAMEKYAGGPARVISENFRSDIFEELKRLDPADETGWQRRFTMGDGLAIVERATKFREDGDMAGGEAFLEKEIKGKPRRHLTREQQQALLMAQFALWREDEAKKNRMLNLLSRIAEAGEDTFWGTAALGWLNILGHPPLSVYWGWRKGDFAPPRFDVTVKFGVRRAFALEGDYAVEFDPDGSGALAVEEVVLMSGDREIASAKGPAPSFSLPRDKAGSATSMRVRGRAAADTSGRITVVRRILRPRKAAK